MESVTANVIYVVDDGFDVAQEEAAEDFHRAGAMQPLRTSYGEATKELAIGLAIGGTFGVLGMLLGIFQCGFEVGLVVLLTMVTMLVVTTLVGVLLPFVLTRLKLDPASAGG